MSDPIKPLWWAWNSEYPEDGGVIVQAVDEAEAKRLGAVENIAEGEDEVEVTPVTAADIYKLQDTIEDQEAALANMSKRLQTELK